MKQRECKHPTCGDTCRREKPKGLNRSRYVRPTNKNTSEGSLGHLDRKELLQMGKAVMAIFVKERDQNDGCISCGTKNGPFEAGHYFAAGVFTGVMLDEVNVNKQCKTCNCFMESNATEYYMGMVAKYGAEAVKALEDRANATKLYKWHKDDLIEFIKTTQLRVNELRTKNISNQ
jgi:hypothetical protein